ncbi:MAG: EFR1 family ferrodoxin [Paludibacteraceae bacterium]|nr:EFR1 family ferrodoxin [Paludibacteraceae bacterium]
MILYFSGTGNCLSVAQQLAEKTNDSIMSLYDAVNADLTKEDVIGMVYPTYYFNPPQAVLTLSQQLVLPTNAYVYIVIPCGAQTGDAVWAVRQILKRKCVKVDYCHKVRVPDCSAIGFGRDPNAQVWKFEKYKNRITTIADDINARRRANHYGNHGIAGWLCALPAIRRKTLPLLQPAVNPDKCIGCGTCLRVCPQANITLIPQTTNSNNRENSIALIGDKCVQCLACVHFCPQQAVEIAGKTTLKLHQYHNPNIRLKDMLRR